jgi:dinuclear metal center YbgI/SA1388 family protein
MRIQDIQKIIEEWAPTEIAQEEDNVGLQVGSSEKEIRRILVALEITPEVIREAIRKKADLIVTHHPMLFHPLKTVTDSTSSGRFVQQLVQNDLAVYSAHTNLDFARDGVSFALAERLGLVDINFLEHSVSGLKKISVFVPPDHVDGVADAMANAGAGIIGDYERCSFRIHGTGTFQPQPGASPSVGTVGNFEKVPEVRLEMLVPGSRLTPVISAMLTAHPYEEVAYDVYPLENRSRDFGAGAIGNLKTSVSLRHFLKRIKASLSIPGVRFSGDPDSKVKRVAVCGGAGGSLLPAAIKEQADVFVTADVKYHTFQDARDKIALVDAGHYETEWPVLEALVRRLRRAITESGEEIRAFVTTVVTNPIVHS